MLRRSSLNIPDFTESCCSIVIEISPSVSKQVRLGLYLEDWYATSTKKANRSATKPFTDCIARMQVIGRQGRSRTSAGQVQYRFLRSS
jgi:hypothetical protein